MNQSLTHNISSHGRFRGTLKSLEKLMGLQTLPAHLRHSDLSSGFLPSPTLFMWIVTTLSGAHRFSGQGCTNCYEVRTGPTVPRRLSAADCPWTLHATCG